MASFCCLSIVIATLQTRLKGKEPDQIEAINVFPFKNKNPLSFMALLLWDATLNRYILICLK